LKVNTGEEEEETVFSCRAKLYTFEKEWKERGVGVLKLNIRYENQALASTDTEEKPADEADLEAGGLEDFSAVERRGRLIMRTDGVHRVVLNTPIFKDMNVGTADGEEPTGKTMFLTGLEDGKPTAFQIKVCSPVAQ
jgi:Ran-binding protein 3